MTRVGGNLPLHLPRTCPGLRTEILVQGEQQQQHRCQPQGRHEPLLSAPVPFSGTSAVGVMLLVQMLREV